MDELVRYIAKSLVEKPAAVEVTTLEREGECVIQLRVDPSDMGKVIGKQGRIAKAIRTVVRRLPPRAKRPILWTSWKRMSRKGNSAGRSAQDFA